MKIKKETLAPIIIVALTAFLTVAYYLYDVTELRMSLLCFLTALAWMFERFKAINLEHKLHKSEEAAKAAVNG